MTFVSTIHPHLAHYSIYRKKLKAKKVEGKGEQTSRRKEQGVRVEYGGEDWVVNAWYPIANTVIINITIYSIAISYQLRERK